MNEITLFKDIVVIVLAGFGIYLAIDLLRMRESQQQKLGKAWIKWEGPEPSLSRYLSHKEVRARQILNISRSIEPSGIALINLGNFYTLKASAAWMHKYKPYPGGYLVFYADGYISFSPPEAFESGYTLIE